MRRDLQQPCFINPGPMTFFRPIETSSSGASVRDAKTQPRLEVSYRLTGVRNAANIRLGPVTGWQDQKDACFH